MMLATVIAVHLFWIVPICNAVKMGKQLTANLTFIQKEKEDEDGNESAEEDS